MIHGGIPYFRGMGPRIMLPCIFLLTGISLYAQEVELDSSFSLVLTVYNPGFRPLSGVHIVNMRSGRGTTTDRFGMFRSKANPGDIFLFTHIAYQDTLISEKELRAKSYLIMKRNYYSLPEAKIFEWGSTYGDFREAIISMPNQQTLGESLGWPRADPNLIPDEMNEEKIKSTGFLLTSPVSYFYHNYNKKARNARKLYWRRKNRAAVEAFDALIAPENLAQITGYSGEDLMKFMAFLFMQMKCDYKCSEVETLTEIYSLYQQYHTHY